MPKAVQLLLNSYLPEDLRNYNDQYDGKTLNRILADIADKYPDRFAELQHKMAGLGRKASYLQGETISLKDLAPVIDRKKYYDSMASEMKGLDKKAIDFAEKRDAIHQKYNTMIEKDTALAALAGRNEIAMSVLSGARGKNPQLKAMISTPGTYSDYKGRPIPVFSKESFADGVRPALFLASTYGSRSSVISTKSSTAKGGDIAKQFASAAANLVVRKEDCGTDNGRILPIDDDSLKGRALAMDVAGIPAGTYIDKEVLRKLRKAGVENVVARSMLTCGVTNGVCSKCVGHFYDGGKLPKVGTHIGAIASTASTEPVTQMALCLSADTFVRKTDGSEVAISHIKPGDKVYAYNVKTGKIAETEVVRLYDRGEQEVFDYWFSGNKTVTCTRNHKFLVQPGQFSTDKSGWKVKTIGDAYDEGEESDTLSSFPVVRAGDTSAYFTAVTLFMQKPRGKKQCYDIEIAHPDHLFVLANGLITHNSAKHTAGMTQSKRSYSGLPYITQFVQSPEAFKDKAPVAEEDGRVESVQEAPQGGYYVTVNGHKHYVPTGHEVLVKEGQQLEAGDQLSEGLVDAEDIVRTKGLGAGRLYYADRLNQILADSGTKVDKRNTEALARATIHHVHINNPDGIGNYLPGDTADYEAIASSYTPPEKSRRMRPQDAVGLILQKPVLTHTIGTRVTPSMAKQLASVGYKEVLVDDTAPDFEPEMERLRTASHTTRDWLASQATSYLSQQLNESAVRGDDTDVEHNEDYRPRLMYGKDFGKNTETTGQF